MLSLFMQENSTDVNNTSGLPDSPLVRRKQGSNAIVVDCDGDSSGAEESASNASLCQNIDKMPQSSSSNAYPALSKVVTSCAKSPVYTVYQDKEVDIAVKSGNLTKELRHRIIRGTIHNMISVAFNAPWCRMPNVNELSEMAKSLVTLYPPLHDPVTKHVSIWLIN